MNTLSLLVRFWLEGRSFSCAHQFYWNWLLKDKSELDFTVRRQRAKGLSLTGNLTRAAVVRVPNSNHYIEVPIWYSDQDSWFSPRRPLIDFRYQIKSLLLSHHHSTSALVSEILTSVLQTVQKNKTTIYIWTVHIYRLYRRQCAKYTYIYSVHTVYYKDILRYQCTNTHYTPYLHVCIMSTSMHSNM